VRILALLDVGRYAVEMRKRYKLHKYRIMTPATRRWQGSYLLS
jgi:hypothetical protein